jgi:hypothetical protein
MFGSWFDVEGTTDELLKHSIQLLNQPNLAVDSSHAFLKMTFDPETQLRTSFWSNPAMAALFGMTENECYQRLSSYDLESPFPELDTVRAFLYLMLRDLVVPSVARVKYLRFARSPVTGQCIPSCKLVCWSSLANTDSLGRVVEVSNCTESHQWSAWILLNIPHFIP